MTEDEVQDWWQAIPRNQQGEILDRMFLNPGDAEDEDEFLDTMESLWVRWDMGLTIRTAWLRMVRGWLMEQNAEVEV